MYTVRKSSQFSSHLNNEMSNKQADIEVSKNLFQTKRIFISVDRPISTGKYYVRVLGQQKLKKIICVRQGINSFSHVRI